MNRKLSYLLALLLSATFPMLTGCFLFPSGGNSAPSAPTAQIYTQLNSNGILAVWPNANIVGSAAYTYSCDVNSDQYCITNFNSSTNSNGLFTLQSDALPGAWLVGAAADTNCPAGAGQGILDLSTTQTSTVTCGSRGNGNAAVAPTRCYLNPQNGLQIPCSGLNITLTIPDANMPMDHAMVVSSYSDSSSLGGQANVGASSSTTITAPLTLPDSLTFIDGGGAAVVVTVVDPNTNVVMGAGEIVVLNAPTCPGGGGQLPPPGSSSINSVQPAFNCPPGGGN